MYLFRSSWLIYYSFQSNVKLAPSSRGRKVGILPILYFFCGRSTGEKSLLSLKDRANLAAPPTNDVVT